MVASVLLPHAAKRQEQNALPPPTYEVNKSEKPSGLLRDRAFNSSTVRE